MNLSEALQSRATLFSLCRRGRQDDRDVPVAHELAARGCASSDDDHAHRTGRASDHATCSSGGGPAGHCSLLAVSAPVCVQRRRPEQARRAAGGLTRTRAAPPWAWCRRARRLTASTAQGSQPHEPVIPQSATLVVPIAGLSALGEPLDRRTSTALRTRRARTGSSTRRSRR